MSQSLLSISNKPWRLSFERISSSLTGRGVFDADAETITFEFEVFGSGVVVVPLLTYNWRALVFACGVVGVVTFAGKILLFVGVCFGLFNVFVDNEDDWVLRNKFDRSNSERGTRIFVSILDTFVASASAKRGTIKRTELKIFQFYLLVMGIECILLIR